MIVFFIGQSEKSEIEIKIEDKSMGHPVIYKLHFLYKIWIKGHEIKVLRLKQYWEITLILDCRFPVHLHP